MEHPFLLWPGDGSPAYMSYKRERFDLETSCLPKTRKIRNRIAVLEACMKGYAKAWREAEKTDEQKLAWANRCKYKHDVPWSAERVRERLLFVLMGVFLGASGFYGFAMAIGVCK